MNKNGLRIEKSDIPDAFADFFNDKVQGIVNETIIDPKVYNGKRKLNAPSENFMTHGEILKAVQTLKTKNCEGHDRLPQRILTDGISVLIAPLSELFQKIYEHKTIPEQWLISKTIPIYKKMRVINFKSDDDYMTPFRLDKKLYS